MSYGIAIISAYLLIYKKSYKLYVIRPIISSIIIFIFCWHGIIKYSIWQGINSYEIKKYEEGIKHLNRVILLYPKKMSKFHLMLGHMYSEIGDTAKSFHHGKIAAKINPKYDEAIQNIIKN